MTDTGVPSTMRAVIVQEGKTVAVQQTATSVPTNNEILIKTEAVALNPTDWKHLVYITTLGAILGCDFAGTVVKVGSDISADIAIGDKVAGCTRGGISKDRGSFAEYVKTPADLVWKVPEGTMSFEEASTTGIGLYTAIQALYGPEDLELVEPYEPKPAESSWVFIYGGSTSVGQYAIQLAHLSGYKVASVASPNNHNLVKDLGADVVFDYKDPEAVYKIKKATGDSIRAAVDTISSDETVLFTVKAMSQEGPGKLITLLPTKAESTPPRIDVIIKPTFIYTALGLAEPQSEMGRAHLSAFLQKKLPRLVAEGKIKANVIKFWPGGLDKIQEGMQYMMDGKVSAEKLVYDIN